MCRLGPISTVQVTVKGLREVDALSAAGFNISSVAGRRVTVHASAEELGRLRVLGYTVKEWERPRTAEGYPTYEEVTSTLHDYATAYPHITYLTSLGESVLGRQLWALLITDNPGMEEDEPEFKYVSTMHGDEPLGTILCVYFIEKLLSDYGSDARVSQLVDSTAIWIVPLMNPDGYQGVSRFNASGVDLNRDFPIYPDDYMGNRFDGTPLLDEGRQPETVHIMTWTAQNSFVLSANIHTGALVVNYPYDDDGGFSGVDQPTPDDALFEYLALQYAQHNPPVYASAVFPQGITNGAAWFVIRGGMQDWMYRYTSCFEVTLELSEERIPPASALPQYWADNEESMMAYLEAVHIGVRGLVTDARTGAPLYAKVLVEGNSQPVFTDPDVGDYHRLLLPGPYTLHFSAPGYATRTMQEVTVSDGPATRLDIQLQPSSQANPCPAALVFSGQPMALARLRAFRDQVLMPTPAGQIVVEAYYAASPSLVDLVANSPIWQAVFAGLTRPFIVLGSHFER